MSNMTQRARAQAPERGPQEAPSKPARPVQAWTPFSAIDIPEAVKDHFKNKGFHLRWVRYRLGGVTDGINMEKIQHDGYELVKRDEMPGGEMRFSVAEVPGMGEFIIRGDLALAKVPLEMAAAREEYFRQLAELNLVQKGVPLNAPKGGSNDGLTSIVDVENKRQTFGGGRQVLISE